MTKDEIGKICSVYGLKRYTVNSDMSIDIHQSVAARYFHNLYILPIQVNRADYNFDFSENNLTTLKGFPSYVGGRLSISMNKISSLQYCPKYVGDNFICNNNNLTNLIGCPEFIGGDFCCYNNQLTSLEGCPEKIIELYCSNNMLTRLTHVKYVEFLVCSNNKITTLEGCPEIRNDFYCDKNLLTNLNHCPQHLYGDFDCSYNKLTSLLNIPKTITGDFYCSNNPIPIYEYRYIFYSKIDGEIEIGHPQLNDFFNTYKNPSKKDLPRLLSELRKFDL